MTKDEYRLGSPGGKHHDALQAWVASDDAVLQWRYAYGDSWNDYRQVIELTDSIEVRIKPDALRYRVALYRTMPPWFSDAPLGWLHTTAVNTVTQMQHLEMSAGFVRWLGDWQEVEVNHE